MSSIRRTIPFWAPVAALLLAVAWLRPWLDSALVVRVTIQPDGAAPVTIYRATALFSADEKRRPELPADLDLRRWSGKLARIDIIGAVRRRWMQDSSTGYVACAAQLLTPDGKLPFEFVSWQQGARMGMHVRQLGPVACRADGGFVFAQKGTLWRALRLPRSARLQLRLRPLLNSELNTRPQPFIAVTAARSALLPTPAVKPTRPPDVFIYLIDACRPDRLGCYGYDRPTSPAIDSFAREATLYENAYAASTWTRPSVATILTGLYACVHGAMHETDALAQWPALLPEMLRPAGYTTRCIAANGNITTELGFNQGYDEFVFLNEAPATLIDQMVAKRLAPQPPSKPVFMYLHTVETHGPWNPGPEALRRFDRGLKGRYDGSAASLDKISVLHPQLSEADLGHLIDLYDARISEADQGFAQFIDTLKRAGRYDNSLIILLSDHGEAFAEHDTFGHGWGLNRDTMHVLLAVKFPRGRDAGVRAAQPVSLIDVAPTVLAEAGVSPPRQYRLPGRSLAPAGLQSDRRIFAEVSMWEANNLDLVAVIDEDGYKRVIDASVLPRETAPRKSVGLWDTRPDPGEHTDLTDTLPVRAAYDEQLIAGWLLDQLQRRQKATGAPAPKIRLSEDLKRNLQNLGYLKGGHRP